MVRYDDYKPRAEAANGYGGRKVAYVDEIRWIPMPDVATRVASLESGEVDFADDLQAVAYDRLKDNPKLRPLIVRPYAWAMAVFNKKEGLMTNVKLRQAVQAAVDIEPVMRAAVGNPLFYRLDSGLAFTEQTAWHSKAGGDAYNQRNKDKAKKLLQEAGYKGEPIRFITTKEYEWMYNVALVTKQQLEDVGMTIDLQVVDWATLVQRRNNEKMYDIFTTGMSLVPDPTQHPYLRCDWPGWTCDEAITSRMDAIRKEPDPTKRKALWEEVHRAFYERVPVIRYGDLFGLRAMQASVKGYNERRWPSHASTTCGWTSSLGTAKQSRWRAGSATKRGIFRVVCPWYSAYGGNAVTARSQSRARSASSSTSRTRIGCTTVWSRISTDRVRAQVVHPDRVRRRPALRPDEDVVRPVLDAHERGLPDRAGLVAGVGHDDHRQPGVAKSGAFGAATALVQLDLVTHPIPGAGDILCHGVLLAFIFL